MRVKERHLQALRQARLSRPLLNQLTFEHLREVARNLDITIFTAHQPCRYVPLVQTGFIVEISPKAGTPLADFSRYAHVDAYVRKSALTYPGLAGIAWDEGVGSLGRAVASWDGP